LSDPVSHLDYQLGPWLFHSQQHQLESPDQIIELTPVQSAILLNLIEHYPQAVASERLIELVGAELTRNKLYQGIARLRRVFNDSVHRANFIGTIAKQGYCLAIEPKMVNATAGGGVTSSSETGFDLAEQTNKDTVLNSVNLLDDLSFLSKTSDIKPATTDDFQPDVSKYSIEEAATTSTVQLIASNESVLQADADLNELAVEKSETIGEDTIGEESIGEEIIAEQVIAEQELEHSLKDGSSSNQAADWRRLLIAAVIVVILFCAALLGRWWVMTPHITVDEPNGSDLVYVTAITYDISTDNLPTFLPPESIKQVSQNIGWWLNQKIEHIGPNTVVKQPDVIDFPRLDTALSYGPHSVEIRQTYYKNEQSTPVKLMPHQLDYNGTLASKAIDDQLIKLYRPNSQIKLAADQCAFTQFATTGPDTVQASANFNQEVHCLFALKQQLHQLSQQPSDEERNTLLQQLIGVVKKQYPDHSLGFRAAAQQALASDNISEAIKQYELLLARNKSQVNDFMALAQLYRQQALYSLSLRLIHAAQRVAPSNQRLAYWQAIDLSQLGYHARANQLANEQFDLSTNEIEVLRFSHFSIDSLSAVAQSDLTVEAPQLAKEVQQSLVNNSLLLDHRAPALAIIEPQHFKNTTEKWRYVMLLSVNGKLSKALAFAAQHQLTPQASDVIAVNDVAWRGDKLLYLIHYARLLQLSDQELAARTLLQALVKFFTNGQVQPEFYSTYLAQTYALLGENTKAIDELTRVISTGWMPDPRYDLANLLSNPNLSLLVNNEQFLALVELVNNRRAIVNDAMNNAGNKNKQ